MVYATGGGGWLDIKSSTGSMEPWEKSRAAWVVGAGIEQAFARNWSWKLEYLHLDTGTFETFRSSSAFGTLTLNGRVKDDIVRLGINYHL